MESEKKNVEVEEKKEVAPKKENVPASYAHPFWSIFNDFFEDGTDEDVMRTDISDEGKNYKLEVEVPGVDKKDIHVALKNGYLTISAKTQRNSHEGSGKYLHTERYFGSFSRSYYVGNQIEKKDLAASYNDGLLTVTIAKPTPKEEESNEISIA